MRPNRLPFAALLLVFPAWFAPACAAQDEEPPHTIRAEVQLRPGGPVEEVDVPVHRAPVDPLSVPAAESDLPADDLVLGVVEDGRAMAWPIRYLALYEVVNDSVGELPVAPTW